jgi:hypothetical protein
MDEIDWASLEHAYGPATDTPAHLSALSSTDPKTRADAVRHLDTAVLHQGFPYSATAPATAVVAGLLAGGAITSEVQTELVEFLGGVASATRTAEQQDDFADLVAPLQQVIRTTYALLVRLLDDPGSTVRKAAVLALVAHVETRALADKRSDLIALLSGWTSTPSDDRALWVRLTGEMGGDTRPFLDDSDEQVRICAALAPNLASNDSATDIIVSALAKMADDPVLYPGLYGIETLIEAALGRVDIERIVEPAATIVRRANKMGFWTTWGPLLLAAFPVPYGRMTALSPAQREILSAVVANTRIWDYTIANSGLVFRQAGLPFDRVACAQIASTK